MKKIIIIFLLLLLLAFFVFSDAPTTPTQSPVNASVWFNDVTLSCTSTDTEGDTIHYEFYDNYQVRDIRSNEWISNVSGGTATGKLNYGSLTIPNSNTRAYLTSNIYFQDMNWSIEVKATHPDIEFFQIDINKSTIYSDAVAGATSYNITLNVSNFTNTTQLVTFKAKMSGAPTSANVYFNWSMPFLNGNNRLRLSQNSTNNTYFLSDKNRFIRGYYWDCKACNSTGACSGFAGNKTISLVNLSTCDASFTNQILNYTIKDEINQTLKNATISAIITLNSSYDSGSFNITKNYVNSYTICSDSPATNFQSNQEVIINDNATFFFQRYYYFSELVNTNNVKYHTLYLLNKSYANVFSSDGVIIQVLDGLNNKLNNSIINVNKFIPSLNAFVNVEKLKANFEGKAVSYLTSDSLYRFIIEYPIGTTIYSSDSTQIFEEPITFIVDIGEDSTQNFFNYNGISYTLSYQNSTNNFVYTYNDANSISTNNCLEVYRLDGTEEILLNSSCSTSHSGTLFVTITPQNYTYLAKAKAVISGNNFIVDVISIINGVIDYIGKEAWFFLFIFTIALFFVGFWNLFVALILLPLPMLMFSIIGFIPLAVPVAMSVTLGIWIMAIIVARGS